MVKAFGGGGSLVLKSDTKAPRFCRCLLPATLCLLLGCGSEVAYNNPPAQPPAAEAEAPPFEPAAAIDETPPAEESTKEPAIDSSAVELEPSSDLPAEPEAEPDRYAPPAETSAADDGAAPLPWQAAGEAPVEPSANSTETSPEQSEQDFGALFNDMLSEDDAKKSDTATEPPDVQSSNTQSSKVEPPADEPVTPETSEPSANTGEQEWKLPWDNDNPQAEPIAETPTSEEPPPTEPAAVEPAAPEVEPPAEAPSTKPAVDVDELFGGEPSTPQKFPEKAETPESTAEPAPPTTVEPAPSITVDPTNTRHLAWLLGAKFSLSLLANEKNSTAEQQVVWQAETAKLAGALGIATPTATGTGPPAERVPQLLAASQKVGAELAKKQGSEAAALVELAVKSNLLLALDKNRRAFAPVIAKSLRSAAARTSVPADVWEPSITEIAAAKDNAAIEQAVYELHMRMEASVRVK